MALPIEIPFDDASNYSVDANMEVASGNLQPKDLRKANATLFATWDGKNETGNDEDVNWLGSSASGSKSGTLGGDASVDTANSRLDLTGGNVSYIDYDASGGNANHAQVGSIETRLTSNFAGTPSSNLTLWEQINSPSSNLSRMGLQFRADGNLHVIIYDDSGDLVVSSDFGTISIPSGESRTILYTYNLTTGDVRVFNEGTQVGSKLTTVTTRDASQINTVRVGSNRDASAASNFYVDSVTVFDAVEKTASYTVGSEPSSTIYDDSFPKGKVNSRTGVRTIESFTETSTTPGSSEWRHIADDGGTLRWYNSASGAWETSDGSQSQSNTDAELTDAVLDKLDSDLDDGSNFRWIHGAVSNGFEQPKLDKIKYTYTFYLPTGTIPTECVVSMQTYDFLGEIDISNASPKVIVRTNRAFFYDDNVIRPIRKEFTVDSEGKVDFSLIETETLSLSPYLITLEYTDPHDSTVRTVEFQALQVPNQSTAKMKDIATIVA